MIGVEIMTDDDYEKIVKAVFKDAEENELLGFDGNGSPIYGKRRKAPLTHIPYGCTTDSDGNIVEEPDEQEVLKDIEHLRSLDWSWGNIAKELSDFEPSPSGGDWHHSTVKRIWETLGTRPHSCPINGDDQVN
jgi:hypothetical protein